MPSIQDDFRVSQQNGVVGQPSRPGQSLGEQLYAAAAAVPQPGQAFILTAGKAALPADQTEAALAVGIVSFGQNQLNAPITQTVNHKSGVVYVADDEMPCVVDGEIYGLAGAAIKVGDALIYDTAADDWIVGVTTRAAFIAGDDAADGEILSIQVNRIK